MDFNQERRTDGYRNHANDAPGEKAPPDINHYRQFNEDNRGNQSSRNEGDNSVSRKGVNCTFPATVRSDSTSKIQNDKMDRHIPILGDRSDSSASASPPPEMSTYSDSFLYVEGGGVASVDNVQSQRVSGHVDRFFGMIGSAVSSLVLGDRWITRPSLPPSTYDIPSAPSPATNSEARQRLLPSELPSSPSPIAEGHAPSRAQPSSSQQYSIKSTEIVADAHITESPLRKSAPAVRTCFICLEEEAESKPHQPADHKSNIPPTTPGNTEVSVISHTTQADDAMLSCCTQCFASVHRSCWVEWRKTQRLSALRAQLLACNRPDNMACSICKTGVAMVPGEGNAEEWFLTNVPGRRQQILQDELFSIIGRMLHDGEDDDEEEPAYCTPVSVCVTTGLLSVLLVVAINLIFIADLYPGDVLLVSLFVAYYLILIELYFLAILQRRRALGVLRDRSPAEDGGLALSTVAENVHLDVSSDSSSHSSPRRESHGNANRSLDNRNFSEFSLSAV